MGESELGLVRKSRGHRDRHPPHRGAHQGADLQQLEPDRAAGCHRKLGVSEPEAAKGAQVSALLVRV